MPLWGCPPSEAMHLTDGGIYSRYPAPWSTRLCCGASTLWKDTIKGLGTCRFVPLCNCGADLSGLIQMWGLAPYGFKLLWGWVPCGAMQLWGRVPCGPMQLWGWVPCGAMQLWGRVSHGSATVQQCAP